MSYDLRNEEYLLRLVGTRGKEKLGTVCYFTCFGCRAGWLPFLLADVCSFLFRRSSRLRTHGRVHGKAHARASHMKTKHLANMHKQKNNRKEKKQQYLKYFTTTVQVKWRRTKEN